MHASILIASYNDGELLFKTVASCTDASAGLECEILVTDNGSTDGSPQKAQAEFPQIRLVIDDARRGPSPTKHVGAEHSHGRVLVFLDAHCRIEAPSLHRWLQDVDDCEGNAVIVPRMFDLEVSSWTCFAPGIALCQQLELETLDQPTFARQRLFQRQGNFVESAGLIGCSFAITRELYFRLRGCDPDMRVWGSDDADLGLKAWLMGYPVLADAEVHVGHRFRVGVDSTPILPDILANRLRMARKNFTEPIWRDWVERLQQRYSEADVTAAIAIFESRRASVEAEREYLMSQRQRDEFWFAQHFGLRWPRREAR